MQQNGIIFKLLHGEVSFSQEQLEYYNIRAKFEKLANQCRQQALGEFYKRFKNYSEMINGIDAWIKEYLVRGATLAAQILAEHDHYDLDPERFVDEYFDKSRLEVAASHMKGFEQAQQEEHEALEEARNERTDAAGNAWAGGGFGVGGALKGAAQAEALNLAGAAISGTFNMIGRSNEIKRQKQEQDAFFTDKKTRNAFADGIYCGLSDMYIDLFKYVKKNCSELNIIYLTDEDVSKTESLLSNINKGIIPEAKIEEQCRRILSMNPIFDGVYDYILAKYPDETSTLVEMANYFNVHTFLQKLPKKLDDFYKTLCVDSEENAWKAQKEMAIFASKLGIKNYKGYPALETIVAKFDKEYRTVEGIEYNTREIADKQRILFDFFNGLDLSGRYSAIEESINKLHQKASELEVEDNWLNNQCKKALDASQSKAKRELDEFYSTLELDTEEQALLAREILQRKASEIELQNFTQYPLLEKKLEDFDRKARTAGPRLFGTREEAQLQRNAYELYRSSDFTGSEEKALSAKQQLEEIARHDSIDVNWLIKDVDIAIKHYDEIARTIFEYRYRTREESQHATDDEVIFFKAIWSRINRYIQNNGIKKVNDYNNEVLSTVRKTLGLEDNTPIFAYLSTEIIPSGNSGLAFTPKGIFWSNGSALISKIVTNKFVKVLFSKKANELEEKNKIQSFFISWKDYFLSKAPLEVDKASMVQLSQGLIFEASHLNVAPLKEMLMQIREWAQNTSIIFSKSEEPFSFEDLQDVLPITSFPTIQ